MGLSPRVWGSRSGKGRWLGRSRSIPTCVGQPMGFQSIQSINAVYPHVCGAALPTLATTDQVVGSIPTCVGQPCAQVRPDKRTGVYPHVCGAASWCNDQRACLLGLSPRVWGSRQPRSPNHDGHRSIPTCVGQPACVFFCKPIVTVYPHVCGAAS